MNDMNAAQNAISCTPIIGFGVVTYLNDYAELIGLFSDATQARKHISPSSHPLTCLVALTVEDANYYRLRASTTRLKQQLMLAQRTGHLTKAVTTVTGWVYIVNRYTRTTMHSFVGEGALIQALICRRAESYLNTEIIIP